MPMVSVILPVYNGERYLAEAIDSILRQTYTNFELIVINDGSRDGSAQCVAGFDDPRILYFDQENMGLAATLNRGLSLARGEFVARQDQDDISLSNRFAEQVVFLEKNPDYGMVGTWAEIFSESEAKKRYHYHPIDNLELKFHLHFRNPFVHSSMMLRKQTVYDVGCYATDPARQPPEDYELWSRMARHAKIANIPQVLVRYREVETGMSHAGKAPFAPMVYKISCENMAMTLAGLPVAAAGKDLVSLMQHYPRPLNLCCSWNSLRQAMNALAQRVSQEGEGVAGLQKKALSALHDEFATYLGARFSLLRETSPLRSVVRPLWKLYKKLCHPKF